MISPGRKNLIVLAQALRGKMPEGFSWYFPTVLCDQMDEAGDKCGSCGCALGLAAFIFEERKHRPIMTGTKAAAFFDMPEEVANEIFFNADLYVGKLMYNVTAADVADLIDHWIATGALPAKSKDRRNAIDLVPSFPTRGD